jgi:precorrin-3B synthase
MVPYVLSSAVVPPQGWCPSTHRIHAAPDGGLARVKVPGGRLSLEHLRAVADAAHRYGNGLIDLTSRANLQIRGLGSDADAAGVRSVLARVGLSHFSADVEDRRNVVASPTAGLGGDELLDVTPLVAAVVAALDDFPPGPAPAHKFGVLLDGGGTPSLRGIPCDVAIGAVRDSDGGGVELEVAFGQALAAVNPADRLVVAPADVPRLVVAAARLAASTPDAIRMADVVDALGHDEVADQLRTPVPIRQLPSQPDVPAPTVDTPLGRHEGWLGIRPLDDPATTGLLTALAAAAADAGVSEVRLTPWRSLVVPVADGADRTRLGEHLAGAGWLVGEPVGSAVRVAS